MTRVNPHHLSVRTESGQHLGQVVDLEIDSESQQIRVYHVKPSRLLPDMVSSPLLIAAEQVVRITEREMIVDDATIESKQIAAEPTAS